MLFYFNLDQPGRCSMSFNRRNLISIPTKNSVLITDLNTFLGLRLIESWL